MSDPTGPAPLAVVTGASRGLGRVVSEALAAEGYELVVVARTEGPLEELARRLEQRGVRVTPIVGDVSDPSIRQRVAERVARRGTLDLLVNNASELGPSPLRPLTDLGSTKLERVLAVNLVAPIELVAALRPFLARSGGLVVNVSSDAALGAYPGWGGYGASKAALDLATRTMAAELGPQGIRLVSVDPGDMRTEMHQAAYPGQDISDRPAPDVTLPFWMWMLGHDRDRLNGQRFQAQGQRWEVPA